MSKYTTEIRFICETLAGLTESEGYGSISSIIAKSRTKIFDFDYPIFDQAYKPVLETKILKHYYTREIGVETVGLFKHFLDVKMNEIMPFYNKLYLSDTLNFNPLYDVDYTIQHEGEGNKSRTANENAVRTDDLRENQVHAENSAEEKTHTETGNITDNKEFNQTETKTGEDSKTNVRTEKGTIENLKNSTNTEEGTIKDDFSNEENQTGNVTDEINQDVTRADDLEKKTTSGGQDVTTLEKTDKNTRWELFSDTPQGSLQNINLNDGAYLTNAKKTSDDTTGSEDETTVDYGKEITENNTGTSTTSTTAENVKTLDTKTETTGNNTKTLDTVKSASEDEIKELNTETTDTSKGGTSAETAAGGEEQNIKTIDTQAGDMLSGSAEGSYERSNTGSQINEKEAAENIDTTDKYIRHISGKTGNQSYSSMLMEYRESLLNIDMMVINEMADLFFNLW